MIYLRSVLFFIYFYAINFLLYVVCCPMLIFSRAAAQYGCKLWGRAIVFGAKYIAGIDYRIKGHIPNGTVIIASKHQSAWETAFFSMYIKAPCFILKKELMFIPFFGLYLFRAGNIWINRSKGTSSIKKIISQSKKRLAAKRSIIIFPEGTRTKPGAKPNYKSGVATLYMNLDSPLIPVKLNSGEFWPKGSFIKKPGTITVEFLEVMPKGLTKQGFMHELEKRIES